MAKTKATEKATKAPEKVPEKAPEKATKVPEKATKGTEKAAKVPEKAAKGTEKATKGTKKKAVKVEKAKSLTKSEIYQTLADKTQLTKKQVADLFEALTELITTELSKKEEVVFTVPKLLKLRVIRKEATTATTKKNPFKPGEMMEVKAKPAKKMIRARPLKTLNDLIS